MAGGILGGCLQELDLILGTAEEVDLLSVSRPNLLVPGPQHVLLGQGYRAVVPGLSQVPLVNLVVERVSWVLRGLTGRARLLETGDC